MAEYGLSSLGYLLLTSLFFFPISLVSADLAAGWPERGMYHCIRDRLGKRWGLAALFLQWFLNLFWYFTLLSYLAPALAYVWDPALATQPLFLMGVVILSYWGIVLLAMKGTLPSPWLQRIGTITGTLVPTLLLIGLGFLWFWEGHHPAGHWEWHSLLPDLSSPYELVFIAGLLLSVSGTTPAVLMVGTPPPIHRTLFLLLSTVACGLIILVIPPEQINSPSGTMEAFSILLRDAGLGWALPLLALLILFGWVCRLVGWVGDTSHGIADTAGELKIPLRSPHQVLLVQGITVTLLAPLLLPTFARASWFLTALATALYLLVYALLFASSKGKLARMN